MNVKARTGASGVIIAGIFSIRIVTHEKERLWTDQHKTGKGQAQQKVMPVGLPL
jgi:hypothetical protein